nr:TPA_asm: replicase protein [aphis 2 virus]
MESTAVQPSASDCLGYFANKLNVDSDTLVKKIYSNALLDKDSMAATHLTNVVMDAMKLDMQRYAKNALRTMTVPQLLKPDEQEALKLMYPEYTLNFSNNTYESHNFAHASRTLETVLCMNKLSYFVNYKIRKRNIVLKDIGGNRVFHALRGHTSVHVCAPVLNHIDAHRKATADWRLSTSVVSDNDVYRFNAIQMLRRPSEYYCNNVGQNCLVKSPALMFIHSIYDMTPTDVADAMSVAQATIGMGTYIYDPRILMYDTGKLPLLNVVWKKKIDEHKICKIDFTFIGDSQPVYTHSLKNYMSYLETTYIVDSKKKNFYTFQFNENRNGIQFFTITRIDTPYVPRSTVKINHTLTGQDNFLLVTYYEWVEKVSVFNYGKLRKLKLLVPTSLWEQSYDMLKQQSDGSFTVAKAMEFMICYNKKTIVNGQTVSHHQKCSSQVLDKLAYALYVRVYIDKYLASTALTAILDDVANVRDLTKMGPIRAMYSIFKAKIKNFFFPTIETENFIAPYCAWATLSSLYKYPVDVTDAVTFKSVDTILPELVQLHKRNVDFGDLSEVTVPDTIDVTPQMRLETPPIDGNCISEQCDAEVDDRLFKGPIGVMPVACNRNNGKVVNVAGDGDCFFHATILHFNNDGRDPTTPDMMRRKVRGQLYNEKYFPGLDISLKNDMALQLTGGTGKEPVCVLVCKAVGIVYGFNVCVHYFKDDVFGHSERYVFDDTKPTYHYHLSHYGSASVGHYQAILYDKICEVSHELTCDAELQVIQDQCVVETDEIHDELSTIDNAVVENARKRMIDTDILHRYVSADVLPIIAIVNDLKYDLENARVLDLCSSPGGVSQYSIESGAYTVTSVTDDLDSLLFHHDDVVENAIDVTSMDVAFQFIKLNVDVLYDIVIADGSGPLSGYENNRAVFLGQLVIALGLLKDTGNMILRSWRYKYAEQNTVVDLLHLHFVDVQIMRPYPLNPCDDVNYIVCTNFKRPADLKHLYTFANMVTGTVMNTMVIQPAIKADIEGYRNAMDALRIYVYNDGLRSTDVVTKKTFINLLPLCETEDDVYGGALPDMRPVKLNFLTTILQSYLNILDPIMYPYIIKTEVLNECGITTGYINLIRDSLYFMDGLRKFCTTITVTNVKNLKLFGRMSYKVMPDCVSFMCPECSCKQYVPKINGLYACRCDVRSRIYALNNDSMVCQSVLPMTCNIMIRNGATINVTMDEMDAVGETLEHRRINNSIMSWEMLRNKTMTLQNEIARDLFVKMTVELADVLSDKENVPRIDDQQQSPQTDTIADALQKTVSVESEHPKIDDLTLKDDGTVLIRLKRAFHECYNIWKITDYNHTISLKRTLEMVKLTKPSRELRTKLIDADNEPHVRIKGVWYPGVPKGDYMYEYDGNDYKAFDLTGDVSVVVSEYTRKKFEPTFLAKCKLYYDTLYDYNLNTKFELVSGVPGCGKTTYIMNKHKAGDLILSATKEGARDFRKRAIDLGESDVNKNYRTVYSYLYNTHDKYDVVYVDEAMMMHPGMMYALACATRCRRMVMVGDVRQIPYYVRIDYDTSYHKFDSVFKITSYLELSYRCPQDVAMLMRNYYRKFDSASKVVKSMSVQYVSGKNEVPAGYDIYLTFTQSDKESLMTLYDNVNTIHEYQGKQARRVALYRGTPTMIKVYESVEHHIVALTRHTNCLTYYSVVQDSLYNSIERLKGGSVTNGVEYVTTSLFAADKYSIVHFTSADMAFRVGVDADIRNRYDVDNATIVSKRVGGLAYSYDAGNDVYAFHMFTHKKYTDRPELKNVKTSMYLLNNVLCEKRIASIHGSFNYTDNWYDVELLFRDLSCVVIVHDPKGRYDRYRLADVILDYHHEQVGPNDSVNVPIRERDVVRCSRRTVTMPSTYVLVYTDIETADIDMQKKFHYVPLTAYNNRHKNVYKHKCYIQYCVLAPKSVIGSTMYKCKKYYSKSLMIRSFAEMICCVEILQQFNDSVLPNAFGIDTSLDVKLVGLSDITYHVQDCSFDASNIHNPVRSFDCVKPRLMTSMCPPRPTNSLKEVLKAVEKRNCAVPKIQVTLDEYGTAVKLYGKFIKFMCLDSERFSDINYNKELVEDWLTTQDNNIVNMIQKQSISDMALNRYSLTIKKNSKPLLDMACVNTYAALQTVVFSCKDFNTYFCPIFRRFKQNLMSKLVDKVLLMADMPPDKFAELMTRQLMRYDMTSFYSLEIDVSKYDKSQALIHLLVDCFVLRHFGVSDLDVNRWFVGHVFTVLHDPSTRLTAYNFYQRKSGDPSTWILNTVQVLVMIVNVIDEKQWDAISLILASGDDSEVISMERLRINQKRFADVFNYEVKIYDSYTSIYFCSKFIIYDSDNDVYIIPDLFKMIKKFGRHDLKNREHLVSYRRSVLDGLKDFVVPDRVKIEYVKALSERYKCPSFMYDTVVNALFSAAIDDERFESLYIKNDNYYNTGYGGVSDL